MALRRRLSAGLPFRNSVLYTYSSLLCNTHAIRVRAPNIFSSRLRKNIMTSLSETLDAPPWTVWIAAHSVHVVIFFCRFPLSFFACPGEFSAGQGYFSGVVTKRQEAKSMTTCPLPFALRLPRAAAELTSLGFTPWNSRHFGTIPLGRFALCFF